ncbi:hypothetical protein IFR05_009199 [Cadophora sp. M221]|nr:hypothetical protein IFR05_009199 [Cadophora sp. M221]
MDPTNYFPIENKTFDPLSDHQAIRTQIDSDEWDQFWQEFHSLNSESMNNFNIGWVGPPQKDVNMYRTVKPQQYAVGVTLHPLRPIGQFELPQYGSNMILPSYIDTSLTPPWTGPSTSNSSPSATSSRMSVSTSSTSTPKTTPSSASGESFACHFCAQTFAQKCLLNRHTNTHTKPYVCSFDGCTARRATNRDLQRHLVCHDPISAPAFLCTERGCEYAVKGFKRKDNLKRHMENIHPRLVA